MNENNERIIGSCLEINSDIIRMKFEEDKKFPKLFIKLRENFYRRKLIKTVKKLEKANIPLTKNNLLELFSYIYSNFPPNGSYQDIKQILHVEKENLNLWKAVVKYSDNILYSIDIDVAEPTFTVTVIINNKEKDTRSTTDIYLKELITDKEKMKEHIQNLNTLMIKLIMNYTLDIIESTKQIERKEN